ncbi:PadR family transcriptional regulator [Cellulomonas pakistanensis]|uniref:PadR family transcriptional regulator n=2 Tax=Cellulomonas pakistanensis TaxID=992287 RepID=A0A919PC51_9CELL|nr:PadR family transcriptional regulator [Cellulomonas pakistanensis]
MAMRLTEQAYLVLLALADEPRHGYGVVQEVRALSGGAVRLGAGTLYGILDRLVSAGYAEGSGEVVVDGRLRRYYRLTPTGHDALTAETARLAALARRADRLLGGVPRPGIA